MRWQSRTTYSARIVLAYGLMAWASAAVQAAIINGDFETGDGTGWSYEVFPDGLYHDSGGGPLIHQQHSNYALPGHGPGSVWLPVEGSYFATLILGAERRLASAMFTVQAGEQLSLYHFFDYGDSQPWFPDGAYGHVLDGQGTVVRELFAYNTAPENTLPTAAEIPWTRVEYTFPVAGQYQLEFGVVNPTDFDYPSILGLDAVVLVPEPVSVVLLTVAGIALGLARRR